MDARNERLRMEIAQRYKRDYAPAAYDVELRADGGNSDAGQPSYRPAQQQDDKDAVPYTSRR